MFGDNKTVENSGSNAKPGRVTNAEGKNNNLLRFGGLIATALFVLVGTACFFQSVGAGSQIVRKLGEVEGGAGMYVEGVEGGKVKDHYSDDYDYDSDHSFSHYNSHYNQNHYHNDVKPTKRKPTPTFDPAAPWQQQQQQQQQGKGGKGGFGMGGFGMGGFDMGQQQWGAGGAPGAWDLVEGGAGAGNCAGPTRAGAYCEVEDVMVAHPECEEYCKKKAIEKKRKEQIAKAEKKIEKKRKEQIAAEKKIKIETAKRDDKQKNAQDAQNAAANQAAADLALKARFEEEGFEEGEEGFEEGY